MAIMSVDITAAIEYFRDCTLCPRECHVNRLNGEKGVCGMDSGIWAARAALHMWEEPCISGDKGSGAVFFTGCSLGCVFCQNREISRGDWGTKVSLERLTKIFLELQEKGAANLNLVTAGHYAPWAACALSEAKKQGLKIPVVYNSSGYEKPQTLKLLKGLVDVYLPDFKYMDPKQAGRYSKALDYPFWAKAALAEMAAQTGSCVFDEEGYIQRGTIVRHLVLPGHTRDSREILTYLHETYGEKIYVSIMNQFTPFPGLKEYPEINRKVTRREYDKVLDHGLKLGMEQGFFQEGETARESFIPPFNSEGL